MEIFMMVSGRMMSFMVWENLHLNPREKMNEELLLKEYSRMVCSLLRENYTIQMEIFIKGP